VGKGRKVMDKKTLLQNRKRREEWVLKQLKNKRCRTCGKPQSKHSTEYCDNHLIKKREWRRKHLNLKKRNYNTPSYKLLSGENILKTKQIKFKGVLFSQNNKLIILFNNNTSWDLSDEKFILDDINLIRKIQSFQGR